MTRSPTARAIRRTLALATLGLAAQASHATYVVGNWDPTYGAPFTNLGWRGTVKVDVPAACLAQPGPAGYAVAGLCAPVTVLDAKVFFYDTTDFLQTTIETIDFTPSLNVTSIGLQSPGVPLGLQATTLPVLADESTLAQFAATYASFSLELDFTLGGGPTARLFWSVNPTLCGAIPANCSGVNSADFPPEVTYSVVPEPASLALAGLALLALLAGRVARRRVGAR